MHKMLYKLLVIQRKNVIFKKYTIELDNCTTTIVSTLYTLQSYTSVDKKKNALV